MHNYPTDNVESNNSPSNNVTSDSDVISYAEFPTHVNLRAANERSAKNRKHYSKDEQGHALPFPSYRRKEDIFDRRQFAAIDKFAEETPDDFSRMPLMDIVNHLNKNCTNDIEKVRAYFWWIVTRDITNLRKPSSEDPEDATIHRLWDLKERWQYSKVYADMLRFGNIQVHTIKGKLRTSVDDDLDNKYVNTWVAVFVNSEWRLVDIFASARSLQGEDPGDWKLIDDDGKGYKAVQATKKVIVYRSDDSHFLQDPDEFIYTHFPENEEWQLLARPVSRNEFKDMVFLEHSFFENGLSIINQPRKSLEATDGEVEIQFKLSSNKRISSLYKLWMSTVGSETCTFNSDGIRYARLEQKEGVFICKLMFPAEGVYKFQLFTKFESESRLLISASYIIKCEEPKQNCTALPNNNRHEWGYSHAMSYLGLVPITHEESLIEVHEGYAEIRFHLSKNEVRFTAKLESETSTVADLERYVLLRQNEENELVICVRIPEYGHYGLHLYGKKLASDGSSPLLAVYHIAATSGITAQDPFPEVSNQTTGRTTDNLAMDIVPKSHTKSIFAHKQIDELVITLMKTQRLKALCHLTYWQNNTTEDMDAYAFLSQTPDELKCQIRFIYPGTYTLKLYAKATDEESSYFLVFTYIIFASVANPNWVRFPTQHSKWGVGCKINYFTGGDTRMGSKEIIDITVPGAKVVAIVFAGKKCTDLVKKEESTWSGNVDLTCAGTATISAKFEYINTYSTLLEFEVKTAATLVVEKNQRYEKKRSIQSHLYKRKEYELKQQEETQQQLVETEKDLDVAIQEQELTKLRNAILRTEQNNFTITLKRQYEEAKQLKITLRNIENLKDKVVGVDEQTLAIICDRSSLSTLVRDIMRATLLLLGESLKNDEDWQECPALANQRELKLRIRKFDIRNVTTDIAKMARQIIEPMRYDDVRSTNEGAAVFYDWVRGITDEILKEKQRERGVSKESLKEEPFDFWSWLFDAKTMLVWGQIFVVYCLFMLYEIAR